MNIYENHRMKDPRLPFIFHETRISSGRLPGRGNWHENIEILYFTEGHGVVTSNEARISVSAGEIAVLNANALHTISSEGAMQYYCLIVDRSFCVANHFDTNRIVFDALIRDGELCRLIDRLAGEYAEEEDAPYRVQSIRAMVLGIMAILCRRYSKGEGKPSSDSGLLSAVKQALGHIHAHSDRDLSLDAMAELVGISKYYFAREFRRITGHTFVSYLNMIRCEKAKQLLAEGQLNVGEVSRSCGFVSQSYFTKTFRKHVGVLPNAYRRGERKELKS